MKNWHRTKEQFLSNLYSHMKERVSNPEKSVSGRKYLGLPICSRKEFLNFALKDTAFSKLFSNYKRRKGQRKVAPSIDRKDNKRGYTLRNIQFLSLSDNSVKEFRLKWVVLQDTVTKKTYRFETTVEAGKFLGHKGRPKISHKTFVHARTGRVYNNLSN